jgi:hypothetical protein
MNKDLDDRLIPNGEYRDAQNISVGKSEADDIGALETVLGNSLAYNFLSSIAGLKVIGYFPIENSNQIIVFLTDGGTNNFIYSFMLNNAPTLLVTGAFLQFSLTLPITGVSVIEDLLFWTDYNNQPRKINISEARNGTYYVTESDISVAKYNPYQPIGLLTKVSKTTTTVVTSPTTTTTLAIADTSGISLGMNVIEYGNSDLQPQDYTYVESITTNTSVTLNRAVTNIASGDIIYFLETTMTGKDITYNFNGDAYSDNTWPGDPDYLESRFIRLSYRFEFDDGEYSLMAPFTPITFIPKQKGYFLGSGGGTITADDENNAYRSTIVEFMENGVQNIELLIPFPDTLNNVQPVAGASYKIKAIDILYKESDATAVKVVDTINYDDRNENGDPWIATTNSNIYTYNYQSRKPFRTLPTSQTVRVYDKVPVKAFAQETAGNRIIYGNFLDKYSPPAFLNYILGVSPKSTSLNYDSWAEFPTQSVKQNRNYQVGFVLADKFGRQSDVILSSVKDASVLAADGTIFGGDTVYTPYNTLTENTANPIRDWFGDSLKIDITQPIISTTPGLYANTNGGYNTYQAALIDQPTINSNTYIFKLGADQIEIPTVGSYLPGEFTDYVYVSNIQPPGAVVGLQYTVTTIGQVNSTYLQQSPSTPDKKYAYSINPIGWYSYKIVVKQQEQDYYNVYLPGILNGYPQHSGTSPYPTDEDGKTAHIVLFNDNINKVPRDLSEVGPQQKQFRSSVQLYARVENTMTVSVPNNIQFYPGILTDTAITIGTADDLNMSFSEVSADGQANFYQLDTNPLLSRLDTSQSIGVVSTSVANTNMTPFLAIYETEPQESLLDIFWETPTVGLISDLNDAINSNYEGAVGWSSYNSTLFTEFSTGAFFTISPVNQSGVNLPNTDITRDSNGDAVITVVDANGGVVSDQFSVTRTGAGTSGDPYLYAFSKVGDEFVYQQDANVRNYTITTTITNLDVTPNIVSNPLQIDIQLQNVIPVINAGVALPSISNNTGTSGVIVTLTGVNGAAKTSLNQNELQWSMTGDGGYFSINSGNGEITQLINTPINTYSLIITLTDANGTGLASTAATQQVVVSSTAIGFEFSASEWLGNITRVCPLNGSVAPECGNTTYYNVGQGGVFGNGTPVAGDVISTTEFSITFAPFGYYSFDCGSSGGTSRQFFFIDTTNDGVVDTVTNCT